MQDFAAARTQTCLFLAREIDSHNKPLRAEGKKRRTYLWQQKTLRSRKRN